MSCNDSKAFLPGSLLKETLCNNLHDNHARKSESIHKQSAIQLQQLCAVRHDGHFVLKSGWLHSTVQDLPGFLSMHQSMGLPAFAMTHTLGYASPMMCSLVRLLHEHRIQTSW